MSPLERVTSIKVKLGLLVAASVVVAALVGIAAGGADVPALLAVPVTIALALAVTQLLAAGMTSPLREMTEATRRMARGEYDGRVAAGSSDEVGQLARAFNQMAAELGRVDREQRDLVATVSHELRTPLAALTATLENLADGVRPATPESLGAAVEQAERLGGLVGDLLDLSRVQAGVTPLRREDVAVQELVDQVVADLVPTGRGVTFDVRLPEEFVVNADATRLRQLLTNVLENAVRHGPERGRVTVRGARREDRWTLDIGDEGPGVPAADRDRAFERFGTLTGPDRSTGGTGLGLAVAQWVASLHGGTLRFLDPPVGVPGALLRLDVPLVPTPPPIREVTVPTQPSTSTITPTPVLEPIWGRFWPDTTPVRRGLVVAAVVVGLVAGLVLPNHAAGLAAFLVCAGAGLTVAYAARRTAFTTTCLVLAGLSTLPILLLDAAWIGGLCLLAGASATVAGVTHVRRFREFLVAGVSFPLAGLRNLPWLGRTVRTMTGHGSAPRVLVTAFWSLLVVAVFGLLFVSADAVVASWVDAVLPDLTLDSLVLRGFVAVAVAGPTLAAAYLALNPPDVAVLGGTTKRPVAHRFEWLVPVLLVDGVFLLFVAAQLSVLFGGHGYVQRTTGLTYAEYVHQGFGQLTVATLLTLLVVWAACHRSRPEDALWLRASAGLLCALTLVVVGSALYRMHLYQEAYGFTRLRLLVDAFEAWLGLVVVAVAIAGLVRWTAWVARFALVTGMVGLLALAALNPDAWIAEHNLDRFEATGKVDWYYLQGLSADAVPVFEGRDDTVIRCGLPQFWPQRSHEGLSWNLGRARAAGVVADGPPSMAAALELPDGLTRSPDDTCPS